MSIQRLMAGLAFGCIGVMLTVQCITVLAFYERGKVINNLNRELKVAQRSIKRSQSKIVPFGVSADSIQNDSHQSQMIEVVQAQLATLDKRVNLLAKKKDETSSTPIKEIRNDSIGTDQKSSKELARKMINQGVIDETSWDSHEKEISSMSKEANKLFWSQMFSSIEAGDVDLAWPDE